MRRKDSKLVVQHFANEAVLAAGQATSWSSIAEKVSADERPNEHASCKGGQHRQHLRL